MKTPPIKQQQPGNEKSPGTPQTQVERNKLQQDDGDVRRNEDATGDNLDADLYESMEDDMDRGQGGINRGLGDLGDMQSDDSDDYDDPELYEEFEDDGLYDDKSDDVNY